MTNLPFNRVLLAAMAAASLTSLSFEAGAAEGEAAEYWLRMPAAFKCPTPGCTAPNTNPGADSGEEGQPQPETPAVPWVLALQAATLPEAIQGRPYSTNLSSLLSISRGTEQASASEASWRLGTGSLPDGLTLNNGEISGTPSTVTTGASFQVIASYKNAEGQQTYTIMVGGRLLTDVTQLSLGGSHTCAVMATGGMKCWGDNSRGQLGNNDIASSTVPIDVPGLSEGIASVVSGTRHICVLTTAGGVKCWGMGTEGQLGNNGTTNSPVPVDVYGLTSGVKKLSAGLRHNCAVTTAGGVKCWGSNDKGQLGNNSTTTRRTPVDVQGLTSGIADVSAGFEHTCAVTTAGGVKCWGANTGGSLGNNSITNSSVPVDALGLSSGITSVFAGGLHTCAKTTGGGMKCWGQNGYGQLGTNNTTNSKYPVDVPSLTSGVSSVARGLYHTCVLMTAGGVKCWGDNTYGQLGNNSTTNSSVPVNVQGLSSGVAAVSGGSYHTCVLTTANGMKCWGENNTGQLGNNSTIISRVPEDVLR